MNDDVRLVAWAILDRLRHDELSWQSIDVRPADPEAVESGGLRLHSQYLGVASGDRQAGVNLVVHIHVVVGGQVDTVGAYYALGVGRPDAVAALASHLQDHAIELTGGAALPACPGHRHPMDARVVDGVPVWDCPATPGHARTVIA